jgi:RNA polymerase sigma-70 factor (ECF subfamily)
MNDEELCTALKRGEPLALETAIERYGGYVAAVIRHTLGRGCSAEDLDELISDVFVALWQNAANLRDGSRLKSWLAVVARNTSLNAARGFKHSDELREDTAVSPGTLVAEQAELREDRAAVREAVDTLPQADKNLFLSRYFQDKSISQIAEETGLKPATVKSRLFRGRSALKTVLEQKGVRS